MVKSCVCYIIKVNTTSTTIEEIPSPVDRSLRIEKEELQDSFEDLSVSKEVSAQEVTEQEVIQKTVAVEYPKEFHEAEVNVEAKTQKIVLEQEVIHESVEYSQQFLKAETKAELKAQKAVLEEEAIHKTVEYPKEYKAELREELKSEVTAKETEKQEYPKQYRKAEPKAELKVEAKAQKTVIHETVEYLKEVVELPATQNLGSGEKDTYNTQTVKIEKIASFEEQKEQTISLEVVAGKENQRGTAVENIDSCKKKEDFPSLKKPVTLSTEPPLPERQEIARKRVEARPSPSAISQRSKSPMEKDLPNAPHGEIVGIKTRTPVEESKTSLREHTAPMKGICKESSGCTETSSFLFFISSSLPGHHHSYESTLLTLTFVSVLCLSIFL